MHDHIGAGWAFPVRTNGRGQIATASGAAKIEQSIQIILGTRIGERVMRPTFGCRIHELTFDPFTAEELGLAERYVAEAITFWEPRVDIVEARAEPDRQDAHDRILITIQYRIKGSYDERSLVYPFYRIPGESPAGRRTGDAR